jgi:hypothetical protein
MNDICINRHQGNSQSRSANKVVKKDYDRAEVLAYIIEHRKAHLKQVARAMGKFPNQISGRFTELKAENIIEDTGERDEGCAVYRLKENQLTIF